MKSMDFYRGSFLLPVFVSLLPGGPLLLAETIVPEDLNGFNGYRILGDRIEAQFFGVEVAFLGDVNGDGRNDFAVSGEGTVSGSPGNRNDLREGVNYIFFANWHFGQEVEMDAISVSPGRALRIEGVGELDAAFRISGGHDVDGDGLNDIIIGAPGDSTTGPGGSGTSYLVFGSPWLSSQSVMNVAQAAPLPGFRFAGQGSVDNAGTETAMLGDVNGDGYNDFAIGARLANPGGRVNAGAVYVIYGGPHLRTAGVQSPLILNGANGFSIWGAFAGNWIGRKIDSGDFNGDGYMDILSSSVKFDVALLEEAGRGYVIFGGPNVGASGVLDLRDADELPVLVIDGDRADESLGATQGAVGDFNNDGFDDWILGETHERSFLFFGRRDLAETRAMTLSDIGGATGLFFDFGTGVTVLNGEVADLGDFNADGIDDLVLEVTTNEYVVWGIPANETPDVITRDMIRNQGYGFVVNTNWGAISAGDLNEDGVNDLIPGGYNWEGDRGRASVIYGSRGYLLGDADGDNDIDIQDYARFLDCAAGPNAEPPQLPGPPKPPGPPEPPGPGDPDAPAANLCERFDFNLDHRVDHIDFQRFQWSFTRDNPLFP
jgi:hypothetical protein